MKPAGLSKAVIFKQTKFESLYDNLAYSIDHYDTNNTNRYTDNHEYNRKQVDFIHFSVFKILFERTNFHKSFILDWPVIP